MHHSVDLKKAYRLLNHGPVTLVSSAYGESKNVMAASWAMPLDFDPPKVAVVIDKATWTRELVESSGEFALNIPARQIASAVLAVGNASGREGDKFSACGLRTFTAQKIAAPLIEGCVAWLECRVLPESNNQQIHDLFLAEVIAAYADPRVFDGHWHFADDALRTLHYVAGGAFFQTGSEFNVEGAA